MTTFDNLIYHQMRPWAISALFGRLMGQTTAPLRGIQTRGEEPDTFLPSGRPF